MKKKEKREKKKNFNLFFFLMQEVGGAGRLSEDGCASAYKDSLNCAHWILREREKMLQERERKRGGDSRD